MTNRLPRRVFIDTSAFFALYRQTDRHHTDSVSILRRLTAERWRLFTSNYVVAETHALLLNRADRLTALTFLDDIEANLADVIRITAADEARAIEIIRLYSDKSFSFTDSTSFVVSERLAIGAAFSFDSDFRQYGLNLLQP
jgi:predicted nucleic acid-binding protein